MVMSNTPEASRELPDVLVHPMQPGEEDGVIEVMTASFGALAAVPYPGHIARLPRLVS